MKHTIENDWLRITVDDHGAELISIYDKEKEREVLWQADPAYWQRHAPILFPHVGKHYHNEYRYHGKTFHTHQHGFARDMEFSCIEKTSRSDTLRLQSYDETKSYFPFEFSLDVIHSLNGRDLTVTWKVVNFDLDTMYFTIGGHPAFRVPILPDTVQTDYLLLFHTFLNHLDYLLLDPETGTAVKETSYQLPLTQGRAAISSDLFDHDALIFDDTQIEWAAIGYPDGTPYISISVWSLGLADVMIFHLLAKFQKNLALFHCLRKKHLCETIRSLSIKT